MEMSTEERAEQQYNEYTGTRWTHTQLHRAFTSVQDKQNWKNPILAIVPAETDLEMLAAAIIFFAGCVPTFHSTPDGLLVKAVGYYAAIGA